MKLCDVKLLKKSSLYGSNKIFSTCFFLLEKLYKNINIYINGLNKLILLRDEYFKDFSIRIYIDRTIVNNKKYYKILSNLNLDIYEFYCDYFTINHIHYGLFGTLTRYFPLFGHDIATKNIIYFTDIDINIKNYIKELHNLILLFKNMNNIFISSRNEFNNIYSNWLNKKYSIDGGNFITINLQIPKYILTDFVELMKDNKYNKKIFENNRNISYYDYFPFGVMNIF
jgi:hypothetical protein